MSTPSVRDVLQTHVHSFFQYDAQAINHYDSAHYAWVHPLPVAESFYCLGRLPYYLISELGISDSTNLPKSCQNV